MSNNCSSREPPFIIRHLRPSLPVLEYLTLRFNNSLCSGIFKFHSLPDIYCMAYSELLFFIKNIYWSASVSWYTNKKFLMCLQYKFAKNMPILKAGLDACTIIFSKCDQFNVDVAVLVMGFEWSAGRVSAEGIKEIITEKNSSFLWMIGGW